MNTLVAEVFTVSQVLLMPVLRTAVHTLFPSSPP